MDLSSVAACPKLSMSEVTTFRWSFEQDVFNYAAAGYEAIGVWRQKLADFGEEAGVDLLADSGLRVSHLLWAGGFTGSDGRTWDESIDDACQAIRLAGAMNAGCLVVYPGGRNNHIYRHAERLFRVALDTLLSLAEAADVTLAIEPMHPACARDWTFLTDIESTLALIENINSPNLKLVFDTYHFGHDRAILSNLRELVPYLALVQLGDRRVPHGVDQQRCPLGEGKIPLRKTILGLREAGYNGDFDVELSGVGFEMGSYHRLLADCRQQFEAMMPALSKSIS
jgi:sugar phosphate isomerase/epimerase